MDGDARPVHPGDPDSIRRMFARLADDYDRLNAVLTFGLVRGWRRALARAAGVAAGDRVLDVCTGTGGALAELRRMVEPGGLAVGVDFTPEMLRRAAGRRVLADALRLPFPDGTFDAATSSFALRDVADQRVCLTEMARVTGPGGKVAVLEIGRPRRWPARLGFDLWFRGAVPRIGSALGHGEAYRFLLESVSYLPEPASLCGLLEGVGLTGAGWRPLAMGAARLFCARVPGGAAERDRSESGSTSAG